MWFVQPWIFQIRNDLQSGTRRHKVLRSISLYLESSSRKRNARHTFSCSMTHLEWFSHDFCMNENAQRRGDCSRMRWSKEITFNCGMEQKSSWIYSYRKKRNQWYVTWNGESRISLHFTLLLLLVCSSFCNSIRCHRRFKKGGKNEMEAVKYVYRKNHR